MIVYTLTGSEVSLVDKDGGVLVDNNGVKWERDPQFDTQDPYGVAYTEIKDRMSTVRLTREEIKRVINGVHAMQTPTTVLEMRYHALNLPKEYQWIIDNWSDQQLREILSEAEEKNRNPGAAMEAKVGAMLEEQEKEQAAREAPREARENTSVAQKPPRTAKSTPRKRKQEGSLSVALDGKSVLLTPKQLEFMERLSECPGWEQDKEKGEYVASQFAEELSDTMNAMSVGAVVTTLREKGLLTTSKSRMGGVKCCMFKLTDVGVSVYQKLAGGK